jgi:hypothetical protein
MQKVVEIVTVIAFGIFLLLVLVGVGSDGPIENRNVGLVVGSVTGVCLLISLAGMIFLGAKK